MGTTANVHRANLCNGDVTTVTAGDWAGSILWFRSTVILTAAIIALSSVFPLRTVTVTILAVFALSALLGWGAWRMYKSAERAERDPKYLRRRLIRLGVLYLGCSIWAVLEVANGARPLKSLVGLPIGLLLGWFYLRAATRVDTPSK